MRKEFSIFALSVRTYYHAVFVSFWVLNNVWRGEAIIIKLESMLELTIFVP